MKSTLSFNASQKNLADLAMDGLHKRLVQRDITYPELGSGQHKEYFSRLNRELEVIGNIKGADAEFLVAANCVTWANNNGIMSGPGRSAAPGSLVAYSLGVTDIDPLRYGLLFERFIHSDNIELPTFFLDFSADRYREVSEYATAFASHHKDGKNRYFIDYSEGMYEKSNLLRREITASGNTDDIFHYISGSPILTLIDSCQKQIRESGGSEFDIRMVRDDDVETLAVLSSADFKGLLTNSAELHDCLWKVRPTDFEQLVASIALCSPYFSESGIFDEFVRRKHGSVALLESELLHPSLYNTSGILIFQEQLMNLISRAAGYTMNKVDYLRKVMGRKDANKIMHEQEMFINACRTRGVSEENAGKLFQWLVDSAVGLQMKAHSAGEGISIYRVAYLKTHFPELPYLTDLLLR